MVFTSYAKTENVTWKIDETCNVANFEIMKIMTKIHEFYSHHKGLISSFFNEKQAKKNICGLCLVISEKKNNNIILDHNADDASQQINLFSNFDISNSLFVFLNTYFLSPPFWRKSRQILPPNFFSPLHPQTYPEAKTNTQR